MMDVGMFFYVESVEKIYKNIISKEVRCFVNLIIILRLLMDSKFKDYIMSSVDRKQFERYLKYYYLEQEFNNSRERLDLSYVDLSGINLSTIDFSGDNLSFANLKNTNLISVNLKKADLRGADLSEANLSRVDLRGLDLSRMRLDKTCLNGVDLRGVNFYGINLIGMDLQASIWYEADVKKMLLQLAKAEFTYILIEENTSFKKIFKNELLLTNL